MNDLQHEGSAESEQSSNSTNVDYVDIHNAKWNGTIKSDSGDALVTVNSIKGLFLRSSGLTPDN